jgi:hypothetical protein
VNKRREGKNGEGEKEGGEYGWLVVNRREMQWEREISRDAACPVLFDLATSRFFLVLPVRRMDSVYSSGLSHNTAARRVQTRQGAHWHAKVASRLGLGVRQRISS